MFSEQFVQWTGSREIAKHRKNNRTLIRTIEGNQNRIDSLLDQLEDIKKQDDILRKLVKLPPIHDDIRKMGVGGTQPQSNTEDLNYLLPDKEINLEQITGNINFIHRLINLEVLSYRELRKKAETDQNKILAYPAIYPVTTKSKDLSSKFGYRRDPFSRKYKFHNGHDFSGRTGTDVFTTASGRVIKSRYWGSFGNYIEIDHGYGYVTTYGHLSTRKVKVGDKVYRGQKIGEVGNTGRSTAPHLHYEIQYRNKAVDPSQFYFETSLN